MPRTISSLADIERGSVMRVEGKSFLEIAIAITEDNIKKITIPEYVRGAIIEINANRVRGESLTDIMYKIKEEAPSLHETTENLIYDNIVTEMRIQRLSKTENWRAYETAYREKTKQEFINNLTSTNEKT